MLQSHNRPRAERKSIKTARIAVAVLAIAASLVSSSTATATMVTATFSDSGLTGSAEFTYDATLDKVTVKLTNTTTPHSAATLLTGIHFSLGGLNVEQAADPWASGIRRNILAGGAFSNTGNTDISDTWSVEDLGGGTHRLYWKPDNNDGIIGPFTNGSNYAGVNASLTNGSHNPVVAEMATFVLDVVGLTDDTPLDVTAFLYGTGPTEYEDGIITTTGTGVPEPSAFLFGGLVCSVISLGAIGRRWFAKQQQAVD